MRQDSGDHGAFSAELDVLVVVGGGMDCTACSNPRVRGPIAERAPLSTRLWGSTKAWPFSTATSRAAAHRAAVDSHDDALFITITVWSVCVCGVCVCVSDGYSSGGGGWGESCRAPASQRKSAWLHEDDCLTGDRTTAMPCTFSTTHSSAQHTAVVAAPLLFLSPQQGKRTATKANKSGA